MAPFAYAWRIYGAQSVRRVPGTCALAAAAVATALRRAAARWCGEFSAGAARPPSLEHQLLPPCRVRGHAPHGARRARRALETVEKVLTAAR